MGKEERKNDFLQRLEAMFKIQAKEHLETVSAGLFALEKASTAEERAITIEALMREAHSLKGDARSVNMLEVEAVCQSLEDVLAALKRGELDPSPELLDTLHHTVGAIDRFVSAPLEKETAQVAELVEQLTLLEVDRLKARGPAPVQTETEPERVAQPQVPIVRDDREDRQRGGVPSPAPGAPALETVRVSTAKLDSLLLQAEEMLAVKLATDQRATDLGELLDMLAEWKKEWAKASPEVQAVGRSLAASAPTADSGYVQDSLLGSFARGRETTSSWLKAKQVRSQIARLLEFLDWNQAHVKSLETKLTALARSADLARRSTGRMVDTLLQDMKQVSMLPFSSLISATRGTFPSFVRQLSRDQGKDVELVVQGAEIEIDRRILEEINDPLIHLVRNCIDHGIESPKERVRREKPPHGTIGIAISRVNNNRVEILVSDDGAGIDVAQVREAAIRSGVVSEAQADELGEMETLMLIFESGVSTSPIITDISGRGLGLAIVREKAEMLNGQVSVETVPYVGTSFRMILPLTLATFRGVLVQAAERVFVAPTANVERVMRVQPEEIKTVENRETIPLNGRTVPLVRLDDVLQLARKEEDQAPEFIPVLVLGSAERRIAFRVDEILHEQQVLVKGLGNQLSRVRNIAGATVLGSGQVVPILNVSDLMKSAVKVSAGPVRAVAREAKAIRRQSILIVEDSITARMLLKNILESAGYDATIAVDGIDALTRLKTGTFDLLVSDVEMPRMDGFDLTSAIRGDEKLADLPVVLVTARESREDRERGVDVGANAYIVKSSFDQSNLLEVVRSLI